MAQQFYTLPEGSAFARLTELNYIYDRSLGEKEDFLKRVIPVETDDVREIGDWRGRDKYPEHWEKEFTEMEPRLG